MPVKVLIVDDHPMVREGLVAMLGPRPEVEVVGTCADGAEAPAAVAALGPEVLLMDIKMAGVNGFAATRAVRAVDPAVKVIFLTIYEDTASVRQALQAGGSGYLLKQVGPDKLVETILRVAAGETVIDPSLMGHVVSDYARLTRDLKESVTEAAPAGAAPAAAPAPPAPALTPREEEILGLLARGLTNKEIAEAASLALDTVKTHLRSIYRKLGVKNRSQAVSAALERRPVAEVRDRGPEAGKIE